MKLLNNIEIRVFAYEKEDKEKIKEVLLGLVPFDLKKEKIEINENIAKAENANDEDITIFEINLTKTRHTNQFLKKLLENLSSEQKKTIISQIESRLDEELNFFIRLEKDSLIKGKYELTDTGKCYHIRMNVAAFPHKRETAKGIVREIFK